MELAQGVAGPFCGKLLADYGADVVKVEPPEKGDVTRSWGPFPSDQADVEKSGLFFFLNTNKRSVTLDINVAGDKERLLDLISRADVLIGSSRLRELQEQGLDYDSLARLNPKLVMISCTPYGQTGPYAEWNGYDLNAYHLSATGSRYCGLPDREPLENGTFTADFFGGFAAAAWGLGVVLGRDQVGGGQHVDCSSAEVLAALVVGSLNVGGYVQDSVFNRRTGQGMGLACPARIYPCQDGWVFIIALETRQWKGLCRAMGDPDWAMPELFHELHSRGENRDLIDPMVEKWTLGRSKNEIMEICQAHGCPATALYDMADLAGLPHLLERGYWTELEHPALGRVRTLGAAMRLPDCPGGPRLGAPLLGEHNAEIFAECRSAKAVSAVQVESACATKPQASSQLPLSGMRVANFGWGLVGPMVGQLLSFLGAEVYKIESNARIDFQRKVPPFHRGIPDPDRSIQNHACWAGNGSVTLDLKRPEAQELALKLVAKCDVAIENFSPGVLQRMNLGYEQLKSVRPDLIMVSMPAAGFTGPLHKLRTYGNSLACLAGLDSVTGYYDSSRPLGMETAPADMLGGVIGALAVLIAAYHRRRTGKGQHIECSQQEAFMHLIGPGFLDYVLNGRVAGPLGNRHPLQAAAPHGVFRCRGEDRWIALAVTTDEEWRGLVAALGNPAWAFAPELAELRGRLRDIDAIHMHLAAWTQGHDDYELAQLLQRHGVAATPVLNVADLLSDPHFRARSTFIEVMHPLGFTETIYGAYVKCSRSKPHVHPGPARGSDNERVFKGLLGLTEARYRELVERQIIY
ncbi:CaiB/BaiF CoA transferase family protein [Steroidobacter denitrificans]|uniref:CaiB/BaiF CoA transferase family protein n=1 Tax=Steroidobacter denitrificans TaxID=465721 RepID=UPI0014393C7C|nr:CoA transferase [Steroidobacter denitrificans]